MRGEFAAHLLDTPSAKSDCIDVERREMHCANYANASGRSRAAYWLREHVYPCVTESGVVLLDLKQDKYFGVPAADTRTLAQLVAGWPFPDVADEPTETPSAQSAKELVQELLARKLLTDDERFGKAATPVKLPAPDMMLSGTIRTDRPPIRPIDVFRFCLACLHAAWLLRAMPIEMIATSMKSRKERAQRRGIQFDTDAARAVVATFDRLRPFLFSETDRCLFNSLALLNFLARYDLFPTWVIGVRAIPFQAHSWIQHENWAMDDRADTVRYYTPVLAI